MTWYRRITCHFITPIDDFGPMWYQAIALFAHLLVCTILILYTYYVQYLFQQIITYHFMWQIETLASIISRGGHALEDYDSAVSYLFKPTISATSYLFRPIINTTPYFFKPTFSSTSYLFRPTINITLYFFKPTISTTPYLFKPTINTTPYLFKPTISATPYLFKLTIRTTNYLFRPTFSACYPTCRSPFIAPKCFLSYSTKTWV